MSECHTALQTVEDVDDWSSYYAQELTLPAIHEHLSNLRPFIERCVRHFDGKRILEIGTGTGILCVYFSQLGYEVTGLDYDGGILEKNRRLNNLLGGKARFLRGDMFHLPFRRGAFDACYHQGLMEHYDEPEIVRALGHQLEICGRVIFTVPTRRWPGSVRGDERLWSGGTWRKLLSDFHIIDIFGGAYRSIAERTLHLVERRVTRGRPVPLFRNMALHRAGEIGFVLEK